MHIDKRLDSPAALLPFRRWKIRWGSIAFLGLIHAVAFVGTPWYIATHTVSRAEWALCGLYMLATGFSITIGYHRLFAHAAFRARAPVRFLLLFFGAAAFQQSALKWASLHRRHHQRVDTPADPYNIQQGFWYAHMGWILFWKHVIDYTNVHELLGDRLAVHQHGHYQLWAIGAGVITPLAAGWAIGHPMGTAMLAIALRMVVIFHVTFCINSFAHTFGSAYYDYHASGRDHWLAALLTNGEGYHNYHHRFPSDYRNGIRWYHWDPSKWLIWTLAQIGLASHVRRMPAFRILEARLDTDLARAGADPLIEKDQAAAARMQAEHAALVRQARAWATLRQTNRPTRAAARRFKKAQRSFARRWLNGPQSTEKTLQGSHAG
jgi:stearoyl-CoA desaturase (delta-9 desaturase)